MTQAEWYKDWFDSPYYHVLYQYRDETEAEDFIDHLLQALAPSPDARMLDLACGKGRYSRHLAAQGFSVIGLDLSAKSIAYAKQFESPKLRFFPHDMRAPFRTAFFDYTFSFFTSFGYFSQESEEQQTLDNIALGLKPGGVFVLDFFNAHYVRQRLIDEERKFIAGLEFDIRRRLEGKQVVKSIRFADQGQSHYYEERVRLYELADLERMFALAGLTISKVYGDYRLGAFDATHSPRLILVARKKSVTDA